MALSWRDVKLVGDWCRLEDTPPQTFLCGYCGDRVSSKEGYSAKDNRTGEKVSFIRICPGCKGPSVFTTSGTLVPGSLPGKPVTNVPSELSKLYDEARSCSAAGAYTGAVLVCRKMLMNIAVAEGADEGKTFVKYVEYLSQKGFVPPNGSVWVDYIRQRGNEANHEIALMSQQDAEALITFVEMLLRFIYEFPGMVPTSAE